MEFKQAIVIRTDLGMGKGKIAAQSSHASLEAALEAMNKTPRAYQEWRECGCQKVVLKVTTETQLGELFVKAKKLKLPAALIHDAGHTQIPAGSATAVAIGPASEKEIDAVTGELKLL